MNFDAYTDFADAAVDAVGRFRITFTLSPQNITTETYAIDALDWDSVSFRQSELDKIPNDKRGVYAFAICHPSTVLPTHGYILYIGIVGIGGPDSTRSLRDRYREYLNPKRNAKRSGISFMIGNWHQVLRFFFAPVGDDFSPKDLKTLEKQLNTALMPPYSRADLDANTRAQQRAFT